MKRDCKKRAKGESGIALISTIMLLAALLTMVAAYYQISRSEVLTTRSTKNTSDGFFAAEAGLNIRAKIIRDTFVGYNRPAGDSPTTTNFCKTGNEGSGQFACETYPFSAHNAVTAVIEDPDNPYNTTIPPDELFQGLNAQEYRYTVRSKATGVSEKVEAMLELVFKSRLVPMFQFVAFFNKDLEILPGADMNLSGPVHTNGDLYLYSNGKTLSIQGQVSAVGDLYGGRKNSNTRSGTVRIARDQLAPPTLNSLYSGSGSRLLIDDAKIAEFNGYVQAGVPLLTIPEPDMFDAAPGAAYFDKADLRIKLHITGPDTPNTSHTPNGVEVRNADDTVNVAATNFLYSCPGDAPDNKAVGYQHTSSQQFYSEREGTKIDMLDVDMEALFDCIYNSNLAGGTAMIMGGRDLDDDTEGGLVIHLSVEGPDSATLNNYGVRVQNGARLQASISGAPEVRGLTLVTDQAFYSWGNYNSIDKIPASFLADSYNVLSEDWSYTRDAGNQPNFYTAATTTVNAAVLAGTDVTGGIEGVAGQDLGGYNGGYENYPRFHENWTNRFFNYRGSFVSLSEPRKVDGAWQYGSPQYTAPKRNFDYDTDFNVAENLPPMSPRFVYLRQELFIRDFEQAD